MASPSDDVRSVTDGWTNWQIGIAVGAPITIGLVGIWFYKRCKSKNKLKDGGVDIDPLKQSYPGLPRGTFVRVRGLHLIGIGEDIRAAFSIYGQIHSSSGHILYSRTNVMTGDRSITMDLVKNLPQNISMELEGGILYRLVPGIVNGAEVVLKDRIADILAKFHGSPFGGHSGVNKTIEAIKSRYWWHGQTDDIKTYVRACEACQKSDPLKPAPKPHLQTIKTENGARIEDNFGGGDKSANDKATDAKNKGNMYFKGGQFDLAIQCYTEAIKICPQESQAAIATFYQNRAAAYEQLKNYKMVIEDCTQALEFDNHYIKALSRRARVCEQLGDLEQSLEDVTGLCILEGFKNQQTLLMADRVLNDLGKMKAHKRFQNRKPALPAKHFIRTYFASFRNDPIWGKVMELGAHVNGDKKDKLDSAFIDALNCLKEEKHMAIIRLCSEEIQLTDGHYRAEALLLRGTFYYLSIETQKAMDDFVSILMMENVDKKIRTSALIRKGIILLEQEKSAEGLSNFAAAVCIDPDNADIYHHRGHHNIQIERLDDAIKDFDNSIARCPNFALSHVQKINAEYKKAAQLQSHLQLAAAIKMYEDTVKKFPDFADAHALYAQALCDSGKFADADEEFQKALELDPENVQPMVHRGLLRLQWKQDLNAAVKLIEGAIELDSECEYAYEILGTLEVQKGSMDKAVMFFNKGIQLSRTENEMAHLFSLLDAAHAQLNVAKKLGISIPNPAQCC